MSNSKSIWVEAGYRLFAKSGKAALNVDRLAKLIDRSRSGFYHNFYDLDTFFEELFKYHISMARQFKGLADPIQVIYPDYLKLLVEYKDLTFFQKQLFLLRHTDPRFNETFEKFLIQTSRKTIELWIRSAGMEHLSISKMEPFYYLVRETFYTRLNYNSFTVEVLWREISDINDSFRFLLSDNQDRTA